MIGDMKQCHGYLLLLITCYIHYIYIYIHNIYIHNIHIYIHIYDRNYKKLSAKQARFRRGLEEWRGKKWEKVKAHKNLILSRNKTQKTTEQVQKNSMDSENNETKGFPITVNMMYVTDNQKARKRKTYADVVNETKAKPLILENKSHPGNKKDSENQLDLEKIKSMLLKDEKLNSSRITTSLPKMINNTSIASNSSNSFSKSGDFETFDTQDRKLLDILEELGNVEKAKEHHVNVTSLGHLRGHFCSDAIFNLSHRVLLSDAKIKVLEKGLAFVPIQRNINEPGLREDFEEFCCQMRVKWHFRNEPSDTFSNKPAFSPISNWKPPEGQP